jgi:hypothetical protein
MTFVRVGVVQDVEAPRDRVVHVCQWQEIWSRNSQKYGRQKEIVLEPGPGLAPCARRGGPERRRQRRGARPSDGRPGPACSPCRSR